MKRILSRSGLAILSVCIGVGATPGPSEAASDARFFGTYCGTVVVTVPYRVSFWGFTVRRGSRTFNLSVRAQAGYVESPRGQGLVSGNGTVTESGTAVPFTLSGVVTGRGSLQAAAIAAAVGPASATASLSEDGNLLVVRAMDQSITVSKAACGNTAPFVSIYGPVSVVSTIPRLVSTSRRWGESITFRADVNDREDTTFARERKVWTSSLDGRLGTGLTLTRNYLSPGTHTISFGATDSGGMEGRASFSLIISNNPPNAPRIAQPPDGASFFVGQVIGFRGSATDREDGNLTGSALAWYVDRDPTVVGTGGSGRIALPEGPHRIQLVATDHQGSYSRIWVRITVLPRPAGNTPPTVLITSPTSVVATGSEDCQTLVAEASDPESGRLRGASLVWEVRYRVAGGAERVRALGNGERIDFCRPPAGEAADTRHITLHTITVTATDAGSLSASDSITVVVLRGRLI